MAVGPIGRSVSPIIIQEKDTNGKLVNKRYQVLKTDKEVTAADKSVLEHGGKKYHKTSIVINGEEKLIYIGEDNPTEMSDEEIKEKYTTTPETLDGKNDGKISSDEKFKEQIEGAIRPVKEIYNYAKQSKTNAAITIGTMAAVGYAVSWIPLWGQVAAAGIFAGIGIYKWIQGNKKESEAKTDLEAREANRKKGEALADIILAIIPGVKAFKAAKTAKAAQLGALKTAGAINKATEASTFRLPGQRSWLGKKADAISNRFRNPLYQDLRNPVNTTIQRGHNTTLKEAKALIKTARKTGIAEGTVAKLEGASITRTVSKKPNKQLLKKLQGKKITFTIDGKNKTWTVGKSTAKKLKSANINKIEYTETINACVNRCGEYVNQFNELQKAMKAGNVAKAIDHYKNMSYMVDRGLIEGEQLVAAQEALTKAGNLVKPFLVNTGLGFKGYSPYLSLTTAGAYATGGAMVKPETSKQVIQIGALK